MGTTCRPATTKLLMESGNYCVISNNQCETIFTAYHFLSIWTLNKTIEKSIADATRREKR